MNDIVIGVKLEGDSKGLVGEVRLSRQELLGLSRDTEAGRKAAAAARQAAEDYAKALKRQYDTVGMTTSEIKKYEVAQLAATDAEKRAMVATIDATEAMRRKLDIADKIGRTLGGLISTALQAGAAMAGVVTQQSIRAAMDAEQSQARLAAVLRATGHAAGLTGAEIENIVERLAGLTEFDDKGIRNAAGTLLMFKKVGRESFEDVLKIAADLAAFMGTDLNTAVLMIGRALEDPVGGLAQLQRATKAFNDEQREAIRQMVESGRQADAMTMILQVLKSKGIDGVAEAMNTGLTKAYNDNKKALEDLFKSIGQTEAVGGTAKRYFEGLTQILRDLQGEIDGTGKKFRNFFKSEEFLGTPLFSALRAMGMIDDPYQQNAAQQPRREREPTWAEGFAAQQARGEAVGEEIAARRRAEAEATARQREEYEKATAAARAYIDSLEKQLQTEGATLEQKIMLEAAAHSMTLATEAERVAYLDRAKVVAHALQLGRDEIEQKRLLERIDRDHEQTVKRHAQAIAAEIQALHEHLAALELDAEMFGLTAEEVERATLAKMEHRLETLRGVEGAEVEIAALEKRIDLQRKIVQQTGNNESLRQQVRLWDQVASVAGDFFADLAMNGRRAFDNLKSYLKDFLAQMVALFAKRWILQLAAMATGSTALASQAASTGAGMFGNVVSGASNLAGLGALGTAGAWLGGATGLLTGGAAYAAAVPGLTAFGAGSQAAMLAAQTGAFGAAGTAATAAAGAGATGVSSLSGAMTGIYQTLASIPVWGWIAMAVVAIGSWIAGNHKGGPKFGGSSMGMFGPDGSLVREMAVPGIDNGRFFTPSQMDDGLDQLRDATARGYVEAITRLRGDAGSFGFGFGADHDPHGTAQSRVSSMVTDAQGNVLYQVRDRSMDDKEVPDALQLEAQRAILAALQHSDLPDGIAQIINSLDVATATADQIASVLALADAFLVLEDTIAALEGGPLVGLQQQLDAMSRGVVDAQRAFEGALRGGNHDEILAAEQQLTAAVLHRYNAEISMVRQLQAAIDQLEQQAYEFALAMAQRINAVGGSRDIGSIAMNRAVQLRGTIGGDANAGRQLGNLQQYVGAIDTWYHARRSEIERGIQAQAAAHAAMQRAQQAAYDARISALQHELSIVEQWTGIMERASQIIDEMRLTELNPLHARGRLEMARGDAARAREDYLSATGADRVTAANRYLDALQRQLGLLNESYQRPSNEYQEIYNEIISQLTEVQQHAKTEGERVIELQDQLARLQAEANSIASATFDVTAAMNAAMDSLNREALSHYTWAEEEGRRLHELQIQQHQEQLNAITGGMDVELFIAMRQSQAVELLREIRDSLRNGIATPRPTPAGGETPVGPGGGEVPASTSRTRSCSRSTAACSPTP